VRGDIQERMRRMRWYYKFAGIAVGIFLAFIVVSAVIGAVVGFVLGLVLKVAIAALVVGGIVYAVKRGMRSRGQVPGAKTEREVREPKYSRPLPRADVDHVAAPNPSASNPSATYRPTARPAAQDVDDELARLKREMGG
jgi:Family of unknown function (DUF5326)